MTGGRDINDDGIAASAAAFGLAALFRAGGLDRDTVLHIVTRCRDGFLLCLAAAAGINNDRICCTGNTAGFLVFPAMGMGLLRRRSFRLGLPGRLRLFGRTCLLLRGSLFLGVRLLHGFFPIDRMRPGFFTAVFVVADAAGTVISAAVAMQNDTWRLEYEKAVLSGNITEARRIVRENASQIKLLKFYRGTQLQLNTVMSGEFWLSNAKYFNDPYDSLPLANVRSKLRYDRYDPTERKLALEEYERQAKSDAIAYAIQSSIFVSCLTETSLSNLHMWSYYADEHKGFCVEYSLQKLLDNATQKFLYGFQPYL